MMKHDLFAAAIVAAALALPAHAADFSDPTWPCIQRKVEKLSVGLMWPRPMPESLTLDEATEADIDTLSQLMLLRRVPVEDLQGPIDAFVATHGADEAMLGHLFNEVFDRMARDRGRIMSGIADYSLSQIALSARIDSARTEMDALLKADAPDFDKVDALEAQIDWDERIHLDRQKSLTYVCETPILLEKRLYAIAQMLLAKLPS